MDFRKLSSESEKYLIQGKTVKFMIYWQGDNLSYDMVVS